MDKKLFTRREAITDTIKGVLGASAVALGAGVGLGTTSTSVLAATQAYQVWSGTYYPDAYYGSNTVPPWEYRTHGTPLPTEAQANLLKQQLDEEEYSIQAFYNENGVPAILRQHVWYGVYPVSVPQDLASVISAHTLVNTQWWNGREVTFQFAEGSDPQAAIEAISAWASANPYEATLALMLAALGITIVGSLLMYGVIGVLGTIVTFAAVGGAIFVGYNLWLIARSYTNHPTGTIFLPAGADIRSRTQID